MQGHTQKATDRPRDCAGVVDDLDIDQLRVALNLLVGELAADEAFHNAATPMSRSSLVKATYKEVMRLPW